MTIMSGTPIHLSTPTGKKTPPKGLRVFTIVILGDGGVGKSALTMQFVCHQFLDYHDPTIEDAYQQRARIDGEPAQLDILDTAGQPEFNAMREQYMRKGQGFIICYSITDRRSFEEALEYKKLIDRVRNKDNIPCVLVGNKCDLENSRKVATNEGAALASQWDCPFFETSAALRHFVDDTFHGIVREIRRQEKEILIAFEKENKKKTSKGKKIRTFMSNVFKKKSSDVQE